MITILLIVHGLAAVALLGIITRQTIAVTRARAMPLELLSPANADKLAGFRNTVVVLFAVTALGGGLLYPQYRLVVRPVLASLDLKAANGAFEIKEHFAALGLGLLPAYWAVWTRPLSPDSAASRLFLTWIIALFVWWNFLTGAVLNNIRGLF